ncbi:MAG: hypothetical protein ACYTDW_18960 [Planctomycetota bacterium]|jgi:hypothetical protein
MTETETNRQGQKPRICWMAIAAPIMVVAAPIMVIVGIYIHTDLGRYMPLCLMLGGLALGIISTYKIHKSKGRLIGGICSILIMGLTAVLFISYCFSSWVGCSFCSIAPTAWLCGESNLATFGRVLSIYSADYDGQYPTPERWCDLIGEEFDLDSQQFVCPSAEEGRCHYAINPNCEPNSPGNLVLLFETKGGWNQFGGPEILTTENHQGYGCNILFNNGHVKFMWPDELSELKWKVEENE